MMAMIRPGDSDSESRHSKLSGAALNSVAAAAAAASERRNPAATRTPGPQAAARPCQWTGPVPGFKLGPGAPRVLLAERQVRCHWHSRRPDSDGSDSDTGGTQAAGGSHRDGSLSPAPGPGADGPESESAGPRARRAEFDFESLRRASGSESDCQAESLHWQAALRLALRL